jgi:type I restriction enzyme M protein
MPNTTDVPHELRPLNTIFSENDYRWDFADSFRDWVDFLTESFMPQREGVYERLKEKHKGLDWFVRMTQEWVMLQHRQVNGPVDWYDALGTYYEVLSSGSKKQILGQFFTPPDICTLMTQLNGVNDKLTGKGLTVHDPCSGSGRLLLAWHALAPGNYQFGADLDPICAKMTAVNMCIHGCEGEAVCMDSLKLEWRFGYRVNRHLRRLGTPTIEPIQPEQSRIMAHCLSKPESNTQQPKADKKGQLILF